MDNGKIYVFLTDCDYNAQAVTLSPKERDDEVKATKNPRLRMEKQGVWRLLTLALNELCYDVNAIKPYKAENGKWCSDSLYFSLSHSDSLLGVAISTEPCGIDIENTQSMIERYSDPNRLKGFYEKIRTGTENADPSGEALISLWTAKESIYKMRGVGDFLPARIDTNEHNVAHKSWQSEGRDYHISVSSDNPVLNKDKDIIYKYVKM